jgi:hypothetical protein
MSSARKSPKETIKVRPGRQLKVGDEVLVPARVTRIGRNTSDTADAVTIELRVGQKVTANPEFLFGDADDA